MLDDGKSLPTSTNYLWMNMKFMFNKLTFIYESTMDYFYTKDDGYLGNFLIYNYDTSMGTPTVILYFRETSRRSPLQLFCSP